MEDSGVATSARVTTAYACTGLSIIARSSQNLGNPSLLVSEYLPRSIVDFRFVSSSSSPNETLVIRNQSPTGRYWLALYGNVGANYTVEASRQTTPGEPLFSSTFMEDLIDWVTDTSIGLVTAIIAAGVVLCLCVGCCYQVCVGGVKKTAQDLVGEVGDLRTCWVSGQVGCCCARASHSFLQLAPTRQQHAGIRTAVIPPAQH